MTDELGNLGQYVEIGRVDLGRGVHTIALRYPRASLSPGSGAQDTTLSAIALAPLDSPASTMLAVDPQHALSLCGRSLDWIELRTG